MWDPKQYERFRAERSRPFFDLLARILGWAGIADRAGAHVEPDLSGRDRLVGGTLEVTPLGRWWLGGP